MVMESFRWRVRQKTIIHFLVKTGSVVAVLDVRSRRFGGVRIHRKTTEYQENRKVQKVWFEEVFSCFLSPNKSGDGSVNGLFFHLRWRDSFFKRDSAA